MKKTLPDRPYHPTWHCQICLQYFWVKNKFGPKVNMLDQWKGLNIIGSVTNYGYDNISNISEIKKLTTWSASVAVTDWIDMP